jgi:hypothetical protein
MEWSEPTLQGGVRRRLLILVADLGSALGSATPSHGGAWWDMVGHGGATLGACCVVVVGERELDFLCWQLGACRSTS